MALFDVAERNLLGANRAVHRQRRGLNGRFGSQCVERHFKRKANARPSYSAIRKDRRLIGCDGVGPAAIMGKIIKARKNASNLPGFKASGEWVSGISASVHGRLSIERKQPSRFVRVGRQDIVMLAAVRARHEAFAAILDPLQRHSELKRRPRQCHLFRKQNPLVAEATSHIGSDNADISLWDTEALGET